MRSAFDFRRLDVASNSDRSVERDFALRARNERIMEEPMMTEAQRDELKLCQKANVPDKSGEMLTQEGAQHFIDDLKEANG